MGSLKDIDIRLGDCKDVLASIKSESIDLVLTSPPYDNLRDYKGYSFDFEKIAIQLERILKKGGVIVWIVNDASTKGSETGSSFKQALFFKDACNLNIHDTMVWYKNTIPFPDKTRYYSSFEYMFIFSKGKPTHINLIADKKNKSAGCRVCSTSRRKDGTLKISSGYHKGSKVKDYGVRNNVWEMSSCVSSLERTGHPAQFPISLAIDHIKSWSNEGCTVLDPFLGSGTSAIASMLLNRKFIGIEISEEYLNLASNRIYGEYLKLEDSLKLF